MPLNRVAAGQLGYQGSNALAGRRGATLALTAFIDRVDQGNVFAKCIDKIGIGERIKEAKFTPT